MRWLLGPVSSFNRPVRLLMVTQLAINVGFYMLIPYLAGYLSGRLAMAAWAVGLVLGARNLSEQGMFLLGGSLADRIGYKPMILAGLALRVVGFALLGLTNSLTALVVASVVTGFAGALVDPALRAYLAAEAGRRKVEAFALFNVYYQAGLLLGPLVGLALLGLSFRLVCLVAAAVFGVLLVVQARALPPARARGRVSTRSVWADWRHAAAHRSFMLFSLVMVGSQVLNFQVYLSLPIEVRLATGTESGVTAMFVASALVTVVAQVRVTAWVAARWSPAQAIARGLVVMALAFLPLAGCASLRPSDPGTPSGWWPYLLAVAPALLGALLLAVATMIVYPVEFATVVRLAGERMVGTYYGLHHTLSGVGIAAGNLLTGLAIDIGRDRSMPILPWAMLAATGLVCAAAITVLARSGHLPTGWQPSIALVAGPASASEARQSAADAR